MQSPNENIFDVIDEMRREAPEICEFGNMCIGKYADRVEKCVIDLVEEVKNAVNQAWQTSLNSITEEFDRRIRENLREKTMKMFGKNAYLTEIDRIEKGATNDDGHTQGDGRGADPAAQ